MAAGFDPGRRMDLINNYIARREAGLVPEGFVEEVVQREQAAFDRRIGELLQGLQSNQSEARRQLSELIDEAGDIDSLAPALDQAALLAESVKDLTQVRDGLQATVKREDAKLSEQKALLVGLKEDLRVLQQDLERQRQMTGFPFEGEALELSGRANRRIAGLNPSHGDHQQ